MNVKKKCCDQCLFTDNKIVSDKRKNQLIKECVINDTHFICHKASLKGENTCCRGFYDNYDSQLIRIAKRLNAVNFVD